MSGFYDGLIAKAKEYSGVHEVGINSGPTVQMFQKAVDGNAKNESWCMAFVQHCVKQTEASTNSSIGLYKSEHCLTVWNNTPQNLKRTSPKPGYIVIWRHGNSTNGHTGIVTEVVDDQNFRTIEGNYSDQVAEVIRPINPKGNTKIVGFIDPIGAYPELTEIANYSPTKQNVSSGDYTDPNSANYDHSKPFIQNLSCANKGIDTLSLACKNTAPALLQKNVRSLLNIG